MPRFLKRNNNDDASANEPTTESTKEPALAAVVAEPPAKSTSRRNGSRRRNGAKVSTDTDDSPAEQAVRPARRVNRKSENTTSRSTKGAKNGKANNNGKSNKGQSAQAELPADPEQRLLALIERQTALLEQQGQAIEQLAASQSLLTETLLGRRDGSDAPARIEVLPRLAIFVDVPNILYGAEASGVELNWGKVADFLSHGRTLVRAIAYAPISDDPSARTENERFVVPFLDHGYRIATKPLKRFTGGSVKANFDVELAIDVLTMSDRVDVIVLVSGDGDFRRLVEIVGARGVRVEVMAFGKSTSSDLRQVADRYIDIAQYADQLRDD